MDFLFGDGAAAKGGATGGQDMIKASNTQDFMRDVIDASMSAPVVVQFWSQRSAQCKQVTTMLERAIRAANGRIRMVTINVDENPQLAQQMQVRSVPAIFAIKDGRPVDMLAGVPTEHDLQTFLGALTNDARMQAQVDAMLGTARQALADGDLTQAITLYQQILQAAPGNAGAIAGILRCNMAAGRFEQAQTILGQLPDELKKNPEIAAVIATLELAAEGTDIDVPMAIAALATNDDDHEARFNLAMAAYAQGDSATAIKELLEIVGRDRTWNDDGARKRLLRIFDALGPSDPEAKSGRRMLQMMLMV